MHRFFRGLSSTLLKLALFSAATVAAVTTVLASPAPIKDALADSQLYDSLIQSAIEAVSKDGEGEGESTTAPADKQRSLDALSVAANSAFDPGLLQSSTEQVLDSVFEWLNGEAATPDFRVDLSQAKANFVAAAGAEVEKYVASLPVCTRQQAQALDPDADPFSLTCRPSDLSAADIANQAAGELANNEDFFPDPILSAENLPKNENGKNIFEQVVGLRDIYGIFKIMPWILLGLSALLAAAVFFLSDTRRKGLKSLGITFAGTGLFLLIFTWLGTFIFDRVTRPGGTLMKGIDNNFQEAGLAIARALNNTYGRTILTYCVIYIIIGTITLLALRFTHAKPVLHALPHQPADPPKNPQRPSRP